MDQAMQDGCCSRNRFLQLINLVLMFDITNKNRRARKQPPDRVRPRRASHREQHVSSGVLQNFRRVPGHAFPIGHSDNKDVLSGELKEVHVGMTNEE